MTLESSLSTRNQDALKHGDKSYPSQFSDIAFQNQAGAGVITPRSNVQNESRSGSLSIPDLNFGSVNPDLYLSQLLPAKVGQTPATEEGKSVGVSKTGDLKGLVETGGKVIEHAAASIVAKLPIVEHRVPTTPAGTSHPFTEMSANSKRLAENTAALNQDISKSKKLTSNDEKKIGTELQHLTTDLHLVEGRHPTDDASYKSQWASAESSVEKLRSDLTSLENEKSPSTEQIDTFDKDEASLQTNLKALYEPALAHKSGGGGGGSRGGEGSDNSGNANNLVVDANGLKDEKDLYASGIKVGTLRLWDSGLKMNQIADKNGNITQTGFKDLAQQVELAHQNGSKVMYTIGEARNSKGEVVMPSLQQVENFTKQLAQWSAKQKPGGGIDTYELWNEPEDKGFWPGNAAQLAEYTGKMDQIIRQYDPTAKIAAPPISFWSNNTTTLNFEKDYLNDLKNDGFGPVNKLFDQVDIHTYNNIQEAAHAQDPAQINTDLAELKPILSQFGLENKPLVVSEDGFKDTAMPSTQAGVDYYSQKLIDAWKDDVTPGIYAFGNSLYSDLQKAGHMSDAIKQIQQWESGSSIESLTDKNGVYTADIVHDGQQEVIAWSADGKAVQYAPPSGDTSYQKLSGATGSVSGDVTLSGEPELFY